MPRLNQIAISVIGALSMAGCAIPIQQEPQQPPAVQPHLTVHDGLTAESMYRLGRYYEGQARFEPAIIAYREAIRRNPRMVEAYTGLGMSFAGQERYDEAIRQFQAAVVLAPDAAHLHNNLGYAYLLRGQTEQSVKALEQAQRLDPAHAKSAENLRIALAKLGNNVPPTVSSQSTTVSPPSATPAMQSVTTPAPGSNLVEVSPQVFELRTPPKARQFEKIEAVPLPTLPEPQPAARSAQRFKLEISNGNGILGLAKRVAGRLVEAGLRTVRLTNQRPFDQPTTEVQYRAGYAAAAAQLASKLQQPVLIKPTPDLASHIDVRLVLGKDVLSDVALVVPPAPAATKVAGR
ncbi:MAG TPA: LytR C-terminal domain-containing protein [Burkholderiales bacterium]|nr:LytR C-terminal domain-containing protein [Burkholderiales bacterium]